jgi:hypothetical protein
VEKWGPHFEKNGKQPPQPVLSVSQVRVLAGEPRVFCMLSKKLKLVLVCSLIGLASSAIAQTRICSQQDAIQAETEASTLPDWDSVYKSFQRFGHCDDGGIGEGYSETIGRLLAKEWKHFGRLHELTRNDKKFRRFVIRHIDETLPTEYLNQIIENAQLHCPSNAKLLCGAIEKRAKQGYD